MNLEQFQPPIRWTPDCITTKIWQLANIWNCHCCVVDFVVVVWCICPHKCTYHISSWTRICPNVLNVNFLMDIAYKWISNDHDPTTFHCKALIHHLPSSDSQLTCINQRDWSYDRVCGGGGRGRERVQNFFTIGWKLLQYKGLPTYNKFTVKQKVVYMICV